MALRNFVDEYDEDDIGALKPVIPQLLNEIFMLMNEVFVSFCCRLIPHIPSLPAVLGARKSIHASFFKNLGCLSEPVSRRGLIVVSESSCESNLDCFIALKSIEKSHCQSKSRQHGVG